MKLWIYYRISDKGHRDNKPDYIDIRSCLQHFLTRFPRQDTTVFADNCEPETLAWLKTLGVSNIIETQLGNARGCEFVWTHAIENLPPDDSVYLVEDDYVHCADSQKVLMDGLHHGVGRYVTLYDHPGHYAKPYGLYPTRIQLTRPLNLHWRGSDSTTMTFACRISHLKEDLPTMLPFLKGPGIPNDYHMFLTLNRLHGELVVSNPIPGRSTHGQFACLGSCCPAVVSTTNVESMWRNVLKSE